jgi:hypothetical protein
MLDSLKNDTPKVYKGVKEFEYKEEFPDFNDSSRVNIKDYFPLIPNTYFAYYSENRYGEIDTNICVKSSLDKQPIFYFKESYDKFGAGSISTTNFGEGVYFYKNDSLFTKDISWIKDIRENDLSVSKLLLPKIMKIGDSTVKENASNKQVLTLLKRETIVIQGKMLKDCIKIKVLTYWDDTIYLSYIWLQKNLGLVKWKRDSGREDELIEIFSK